LCVLYWATNASPGHDKTDTETVVAVSVADVFPDADAVVAGSLLIRRKCPFTSTRGGYAIQLGQFVCFFFVCRIAKKRCGQFRRNFLDELQATDFVKVLTRITCQIVNRCSLLSLFSDATHLMWREICSK